MSHVTGFRTGWFLTAAFFSLLAAGFRGGGPIEVSLGQSFALKHGEQASIASEKVVLRFASVLEDSRCPKGEQCIVAGKARVGLEISVGGAAPTAVELGTSDGFGETDVEGFQITLVGLQPYPVSGRQIFPEEYVATLILRRL